MKFPTVKKSVVFFTKAVLGAYLIYYVARAELVSFESVTPVLISPFNLLCSFILLALTTVCMAWRMLVVAQDSSSRVSLLGMINISMIGHFFGTFLPGAVGGDVVRAWYLSKSGEQKISAATQTVVWDRIIGLAVTCLAAAFASLQLKQSAIQPTVVWKIQLITFALGFSMFGSILFFLFVAPKYKGVFQNNSRLLLIKEVPDIQLNDEPKEVYNGVWITGLVFGKSYGLGKQEAMDKLKAVGVPSRPFFYPLSSLPAYPGLEAKYSKLNPNAYDISARGINLPGALNLTETQLKFVCDGIKTVLKNHASFKKAA